MPEPHSWVWVRACAGAWCERRNVFLNCLTVLSSHIHFLPFSCCSCGTCSGTGVGRTRAADAAIAAISSPLLDFPIQRAKRIVFNIVGGEDMGLQEINEASEVIYENADDNANIIFGALVDPAMGDEISITVLACDFDDGTLSSANANGVANAVMDRGGDASSNDQRDPNFYRDRRKSTSSPLGPNASLEETRVAITRGFKKPPTSKDDDDDDQGGKRKALSRFLRKFMGR